MEFYHSRVFPLLYPMNLSRLASVVLLALAANLAFDLEYAHGATAITPTTGAGNLRTTVTPSGHVYGITGGTSVGNNLYHSFAQFSIGTGDIAQYQTTNLVPNPSMQNILSRVTGGTPSSIFGTIDSVTYYPNANFFFLNPAGILFGPNATINVGGMVAFTTADYMRLTGNARFNAAPSPADAFLTAAPVAAFGFLGPNPAAIAIQGSTLKVAQGQSLSLVGGNQGFMATDPDTGNPIPVPGGITMTGGTLSALGGQINLVSVASAGEVSTVDFMPTPGMAMGTISLAQGALLDVSADAAGTVRIRGGQLVIAEGTISANTVNTNGAPTAVDIQLTGDLSIANDLNPAITAQTTGSGDAGRVSIVSSNLIASSNTPGLVTLIDTHTEGTGKGGYVSITTGNLLMTGSQAGFSPFIDSGTQGPGHGGDVTITAQNVQIDTSLINTGNFLANVFGIDATGSAGNVNISTNSLNVTFSQIVTDAFSFANGTGQSGNINVTAHNINLDTSQFISQGHRQGGIITINTDQLFATDSQIITQTNLTAGGGVTVIGKAIDLTSGSSIVASTGGDGNAGSITITATDHLGLLGGSQTDRPSGIFSNSFGSFGTQGNAGDVVITTPRLDMTGGSRINTTTATSGHGGNVTINTTGPITMSGETGTFAPEPLFSLGGIQPSGIFTRTIGGHCSGPCGNAGNISITTGSLYLDSGAQINSGTSTTGQGGDITIHASDTISLSGTLSDGLAAGIFSRAAGTTPDSGVGGNISLTAGQSVTISNGAAVSASSSGPGSTGNIQINAGNQFAMTNSSVTTEADQSSGGTIKIGTNPNGNIQLTNSVISASVLNGEGGGGSVIIDPQFVLLVNSQILANAVFGPGGNIFITTDLLLPDATSVISASSQFGQNGTITIQSPISPASRIVPLSQKPLIAMSLLTGRCAALAGGDFSSFTVAGRDSLPAEPVSWLASPLAVAPAEPAGGALTEADTPRTRQTEPSGENPVLSLRRIAPPGFLTQSFAVESSAGCG
jgi:filamentous hemagglutinin family protein